MTGGIELAPLVTQIKVDIAGFQSEMKKANNMAIAESKNINKNLSDGAKEVGKNMTKYLTLPILAVTGFSTKMALDFEQSFAKVSTLLDENKVDFGKFKDDLLKGSSESGIAVGEFSDAVYESISAGVDQTKAIEFTTTAMKLAKGGFTEGAKAVDVLTTAINGYKLKAEDTNKISDMLITTQNLGKTTVDELSESMGKVIPIAQASNYKIEELSTAYAVLTVNGIKTAEAGTYLKAMLSELSKSGTDVDKALRELAGKGFAELKAEGKPTTEILKMLDEYAKKNGKSLKDMFGSIEAGTAALVLSAEDGKQYNEFLDQMNNSAGATQDAVNKMDASPLEQFKKALNELKNAGIELGTHFIPIVTEIAKQISQIAKSFSGLSDETKATILKLVGFVAILGPLISVIGSGIAMFANLSALFSSLSASAAAAGTTIGAIVGPVGWAILAIVALGVAIATNFGGIRDAIFSVMQSIQSIIMSIWNSIMFIWNNNLFGIQNITMGIFNSIKTYIEYFVGVIRITFEIFALAFQGDWEGVWNKVKELFTLTWETIKALLKNFLNTIVDTIINLGFNLLNAAYKTFLAIKKGFENAWTNITAWLQRVKSEPGKVISEAATSLYNAGRSILNSLWNGLKSIWDSISGWFLGKLDWIKEKFSLFQSTKDKMDGSHYNGLNYVPFDGYVARLHKGERVLTEKENRAYTQGNSGTGGQTIINFYGNINDPIENSRRIDNLMKDLAYNL